jgi:hypothetical protein
MAELRGSRSYGSVLDPKQRGAAHSLSKSCVGPGLLLWSTVESGANSNFNDSRNTVLRPGITRIMIQLPYHIYWLNG